MTTCWHQPQYPYNRCAEAKADSEALEASYVVETVILAVAQHYGVPALRLTGRGQTPGSLLEARHLAMVLCTRYADATYAQIGQRFGGRSLSSVSYAIRQHQERVHPTYLAREQAIRAAIEAAL